MRPGTSSILVVVCGFLLGCDGAGVLPDGPAPSPVLSTESFRTVVAGIVVDARTGERPSVPVSLTFAGEGADLLRNYLNRPVTGPVVTGGSVSVALANSARPTASRPLDLRITASAKGYRSNATRLEMRHDGRHEFRVVLVPELDLPGETSAAAVLRLNGGRTTSETRFTARVLDQDVLSVVVPSGARISTEAGLAPGADQPISASWSPPTLDALRLFPGGMDAGVIVGGPDGATFDPIPTHAEEGYVPATLTMGALVRLATPEVGSMRFEDSVRVRARVSDRLKSPRTNAPILPGDDIDVLAWDRDLAAWRAEDRVRVLAGAGGPVASFLAGATGTYALGYWTAPCETGVVEIPGNRLGVVVTAFRGGRSAADGVRMWRFGPGVEEALLTSPPGFWVGELEVRHGEDVAVLDYASLCDGRWTVPLDETRDPVGHPQRLVPDRCQALSVTNLSTLSVFAIPGPRSAEELWSDPPHLVTPLAFEQADTGGISAVTTGSTSRDRTIVLVLGTESWSYRSREGGTIDISDLATDSGICGGRLRRTY